MGLIDLLSPNTKIILFHINAKKQRKSLIFYMFISDF